MNPERLIRMIVAQVQQAPNLDSETTVDRLVIDLEQRLNLHLELLVSDRTIQLQQSLQLEQTLRQLVNQLYTCSTEPQLLELIPRELAQLLGGTRCHVELYDEHHQAATVVAESASSLPSLQNWVRVTGDAPEIYGQLLARQTFQFTDLNPTWPSPLGSQTQLVCPLFVAQQTLGNLWLFRPADQVFSPAEVEIVHRSATACAIALSQIRRYQAAQAQIQELTTLMQGKDQFLSNITEELRAPMSRILLATQTLARVLKPEKVRRNQTVLERSLQRLQDACQQESHLINNLQALSHVVNQAPLTPLLIDLKKWIPRVAEPFHDRIQNQQQLLKLSVHKALPPIEIDASYLERILSELLANACKFTPAGETISVIVRSMGERWCLIVSNSGVDIPAAEIPLLFEQFYRSAERDIWRSGGVGVGLTLVKQLVQRLNGTIQMTSQNHLTTVTVEFPYPTSSA